MSVLKAEQQFNMWPSAMNTIPQTLEMALVQTVFKTKKDMVRNICGHFKMI